MPVLVDRCVPLGVVRCMLVCKVISSPVLDSVPWSYGLARCVEVLCSGLVILAYDSLMR